MEKPIDLGKGFTITLTAVISPKMVNSNESSMASAKLRRKKIQRRFNSVLTGIKFMNALKPSARAQSSNNVFQIQKSKTPLMGDSPT
jgi:hypothetical protein